MSEPIIILTDLEREIEEPEVPVDWHRLLFRVVCYLVVGTCLAIGSRLVRYDYELKLRAQAIEPVGCVEIVDAPAERNASLAAAGYGERRIWYYTSCGHSSFIFYSQ